MIQVKKNKKQELTDCFIRSTDGLNQEITINFMVGYACGCMGIPPNRTNRTSLSDFIRQLFENVQMELITATNTYEIVAQAIYYCIQKNIQESEMMKQFERIVHANVNQIAMNRKFLRQRWQEEVGFDMKTSSSMVSNESKMSDKESMELIKRLQEEERQEMEKRRQMREKMDLQEQEKLRKLIEEQQQMNRLQREQKQNVIIQCQICLEEIPYQDMGTLECGHIFHRKCIRDHIEALVNQKKIEIECPMGCGGKLTVDDVHQFIDGELKEKFQRFSFDVYVEKNQAETSWCPSPGCTAAFSWDQELDNYRCPACKSHYCLKCRCNYHYGQSCAEYRINNSYGEDDKKFEEFVKGAKFKQCPKCKFWVQRSEGCSTMSCRCGHEFCYDCGGSDCPHGACKHLNQPMPVVRVPFVGRPVPRPPPRRKR